MLWVIISHEYKPHSRWVCMMQQYALIANLIQFALHLEQIPDFAIGKSPLHHNRASSMLYSWCDTGGCSSFTNSSQHIDPLLNPKISNFDSSVQRTLFHSSVVIFVLLGSPVPFNIVLLPQKWFLDSNSTI